MPVVVFCEIDFEELTEKDKRKLFVGLTLGQVRVDIVMSEKAPICCCNPLGLSYSRQPMFLG